MFLLTEEGLEDHKSLQEIRKVARQYSTQFKFRNVSVKKVARSLETLNPNRSTGHDKITPRVLKRDSEKMVRVQERALRAVYCDARALTQTY